MSENPDGFKNKDFRYTLSLIYQLVEDEFEGIFLSPNSPVRNTDFYLINKGGKKVWTIVSVVVGSGVAFAAMKLPINALQVWVAVTGATLFYDTIFKSFQKLIEKIAKKDGEE